MSIRMPGAPRITPETSTNSLKSTTSANTPESASPSVKNQFSSKFPEISKKSRMSSAKQNAIDHYNAALNQLDIELIGEQEPAKKPKTVKAQMQQAMKSLDKYVEANIEILKNDDEKLNTIKKFREAIGEYIEASSSWGKKKQTAAILSETSIFNKDVNAKVKEGMLKEVANTSKSQLRSKTFLGKGSFGEVYKVPLKEGGSVIVKIPLRELTKDSRKEIKKEAAIGKAMGYPTVVTKDGCMFQKCLGDKDGTGFVNNIKKNPSLFTFNQQEAADKLNKKLFDKITEFHEKGYIHRDLKLDNIMIEYKKNDAGKITDFNVNLIDFGITDQMWTGQYETDDEGYAIFQPNVDEVDFDTAQEDIWNNVEAMTTFKGTPPMIAEATLRLKTNRGIQEDKFDLDSIDKSDHLIRREHMGMQENKRTLQQYRDDFVDLWENTEEGGIQEEDVTALKQHASKIQVHLQMLDVESINAMSVQLRDGTPF